MKNIISDFCFYKKCLGIESTFKSVLIIFFSHPGFHLLLLLRFQRLLRLIPVVGKALHRVFWYLTNIVYSCDIGLGVNFGSGIYFPHPTGIVIGDNWELGNFVVIMQNVTLGKKGGAKDAKSKVFDNVVISAGAVVIGNVCIGSNSTVGANAVVLNDVPENSIAVGVPARILSK